MNLDKISNLQEPSRSTSRGSAAKEPADAAEPSSRTPVPVSGNVQSATDQVEASPELRRRVPELQAALREEHQANRKLKKEHVERVRAELGLAKQNLKQTLLKAAQSVLTGELYFE